MGILTEIFIATEAEVAAASFGDSGPATQFPMLQAKGIDPVALANLSAIISDLDASTLDSQPLVIAEEAHIVRDLGAEAGGSEYENFVVRLPVELMVQLTTLTATDISHHATAWADTFWRTTPEPTPAFIAGITAYLEQLCQLAKRARDEQKMLYLWVCV